MYIKPSVPILRADSNAKAMKFNKKTDSGSEVFKDILEEIDIVELSTGLDPDEKRKQQPQSENNDKNLIESEEVLVVNTATLPKSINRFV